MTSVVHLITGLETGGAEGMLARLAMRSDQAHFTSLVISMTGHGALGPALMDAGIEVRTLGLHRGLADPRGLMRLVTILRERRPDILQTWLYHADLLGLLAFRLTGAPALLWNLRCSESVGAGIVRSALSRCSAIPDRVVVNSRYGQRYHESLGYRPRCWEYIPNGLDTDHFRPDRAARNRTRAVLGLDESSVIIGHVARFHPMKDYPTLLAAAEQLAMRNPCVVFVLVGRGIEPTNCDLIELIGRHGLAARVR